MPFSVLSRSHVVAFSLLAAALGGCAAGAPKGAVPADAHVDVLQMNAIVLRGTAEEAQGPACATGAPAKANHYLELKNTMSGQFMLHPAPGAQAPKFALLHIVNLDTNESYCVTSKGDGTPANVARQFQSGTYAITVGEAAGTPNRAYELKFEKM